MSSRSLDEYMFSLGPISLNPHDQQRAEQLQATRQMSPCAVAVMRTTLTTEIAALRVKSAREGQRCDWADVPPIDKPATRTLFMRLSQLAVLDARFPPPAAAPAAPRLASAAPDNDDDDECLVPRERCDWSWVGAGLNPNFAYQGPWGPKKGVDAPPPAAASAVDLDRPVSPKTVVGVPQRARVRSSRRSNRRYYAAAGSARPGARMLRQCGAINALYPTLPPSSRPSPTRRVQTPSRNQAWLGKKRGTYCGVM